MKKSWCFGACLMGLLLCGCAGGDKTAEPAATPPPLRQTAADGVLTCLAETQKMSRKEYKAASKAVGAEAASGRSEAIQRQLCLSLHPQASARQFREGVEKLTSYLKTHSESSTSLKGLLLLMQRLEREMAGRSQSGKKAEEKEGSVGENKDLVDRNETLEKNAVQDQARIRELQNQIEQLKKIETIIQNRER